MSLEFSLALHSGPIQIGNYIIYHHIAEGTTESHPSVDDLQSNKACLVIHVNVANHEYEDGFPCLFRNVVIIFLFHLKKFVFHKCLYFGVWSHIYFM